MAGWWWWRDDGSHRGHTGSAHYRKPKHSRMVLGNTDGFRGHATLRGAERGTSDDRKIPARKSGGGLRANDERQGAVPRGLDDVDLDQRYRHKIAARFRGKPGKLTPVPGSHEWNSRFRSSSEFRKWLAANHRQSDGIWLGH